ncbi:restriction endonuclease subunit S [Flavobacterium antarcticum]|uniref:restriction endonuclease subunit S n=1 Tax=Flavobacterium antarcticum TaxID=271155 RepID=UPI0003B50E94|nr:restriction endonuclease subunit S [Flavobacterium antarcticum]
MFNINSSYKFLHFVNSKSLINWSVKHLLQEDFGYNENYSLVAIKKILKRSKAQVDIQDNEEYKRVTIKINNGGVFLRDIEVGKKIGTKKQFLVREGQFLLSKIDARNGAFGVVPSTVDGAVITGNFWTYDVDYSKVNPHYLALITTTDQFISFCQRSSSGTTNRHYLQENLFLNEKIPLPSIEKQKELVDAYQSKIDEAKRLESTIISLNEHLDIELGISNTKLESNLGKLNFIEFKNIEKWGLDQVFRSNTRYDEKFKVLKIKDLCNVGSGGTPLRSNKSFYNGTIPWIKTGEVIGDTIMKSEELITLDAVKNSSAKLYPKGSLIIAMYGQGKTRGRTAKLGVDATTNQACAVLYSINNELILTDYLWIYLINEYDRIRELASGNNQPNLNAEIVKNYPVVIPPLKVQNSIINFFNELKYNKNVLLAKSEQLKKEAIVNFEKSVFK